MKKYYTHPRQDPSSDQYDPEAAVKRPLHSDNDEIKDLRDKVFFLERELARLKHDNSKHEGTDGEGVDRGAGETTEGYVAKLSITKVEATEKAPSGGIISKPKAKAAKQKKAFRAKTKVQQSTNKTSGSD